MFRSGVIILFVLLGGKAFSQIKAGDKATDLHITHWISQTPEDTVLRGKFLIVDFWATWCAPCLAGVPHFNELATANKAVPNLLFLSMTDERTSKVQLLLSRVHFSSAVVSDTTAQTFRNFGITRIPFCVLIDDHMEVKWAGDGAMLTNDIIRQFVQRKPITAASEKADKMTAGTRQLYDSLRAAYYKVYGDSSVKNYFNIGPLSNESYGSRVNQTGPGFYNEAIVGKGMPDFIAQLLGVSKAQVVLPPAMAGSYISYCYKGPEKLKDEVFLRQVLQQFDLQSGTQEQLQEMITLEVTDTARLYSDLPEPGAGISRVSTANGVISLLNNPLQLMASTLQDQFACLVVVKDAAHFPRNINMTVMAADFPKLQASLLTYGIKATKRKQPLKVYHFNYNSNLSNTMLR